MDDNRRDSLHSYQVNNVSESWGMRDGSRYSNRNRDDERNRSRREDRDRRRSRSRSPPPRRRDRDRDRGDRDRDRRDRDRDDRRRSRNRRHHEDRDRDCDRDNYSEEHSYEHEDSPRLERPHGHDNHRPDHDWRLKLTNIRDAHFNRSKQLPSAAQNQFTNDGSFLEKFKQMAGQSSKDSNLMPNSLALASSSIQFDSKISLPPLTTVQTEESSKPRTSAENNIEDLDGVPIKKPVPVPVSIGRRRIAKPLKTGVVFKKTQQSEEDEASQEKLDAWSKYLNEVQQYKKDNCVEEDSTRPLVK